jgi:hypothetical protein
MYLLKNLKRTVGTANGLSSFLLCLVLAGGMGGGVVAGAQGPGPAPSAGQAGGWASGTVSANEITVLGTIRQVILDKGGVGLLVDGPLGNFDAGLGPFLPAEIRQALTVGAAVQLTGKVRTVNGKNYLLVRQLSVGGHEVTLRNANGFLMHGPPPGGSSTGKLHGGSGNGGNQ